ncbi:NAD(P)-binding protein [Eremomyces bilateralis CBS 781.70]|uniref:NAD(P)-binding protein n=1 Tax=Eremomyces bilateralis CBS 781.70 TaxID=1392243 RepID=A0A6G1FYU2_9PEZI|nr:NAD(P)-binding protein [Eremomyces bilateralis CBS 781.70]KAF1810954.1 NAD(P)-binding protein [Eremomyces bilateralis CBS 781.70]
MGYDLKGRNVLITGGSRGLGAIIALKFAAEGCNVCINYVSNKEAAEGVQKGIQSKYSDIKTSIIQGDCGDPSACAACVEHTVSTFGGIDIIIGNAGWTKISDWTDLDSLSFDDWDKCWNVNVKGKLALMKAAKPHFNANPDGGSFIITSSIAGIKASGSSMAYSVTKTAQMHLMLCLAKTQGPKIRVNAVCPGLLLTDWGMRFGEERLKAVKSHAVLKSETDLDECAECFVDIAKKKTMTGRSIVIDAGASIA